MILTFTDLLTLHRAYGVSAVPLCGDERYATLDERWVLNDFAAAMRQNFVALGFQFQPGDRNDCNAFAMLTCGLMRVMHARTPGGPEAAPAFGMAWYVRDAGGAHAINCYATSVAGGEAVLRFFEPQAVPHPELGLSDKERKSCTFVLWD